MQGDRFYLLLAQRLNDRLKKFNFDELTPEALTSVRTEIYQTIDELFMKSKQNKLSKKAITWLTNQYFKQTKWSDNGTIINDLVVVNNFKLSDLSNDDIVLLTSLYSGTLLSTQLEAELNLRQDQIENERKAKLQ
jgi:hypothetical protein